MKDLITPQFNRKQITPFWFIEFQWCAFEFMIKKTIDWSKIAIPSRGKQFAIHWADKLNPTSKLGHNIRMILPFSLECPLDGVVQRRRINRIWYKQTSDGRSMDNRIEHMLVMLGLSLCSLSHSGVINHLLHVLEDLSQILRILRH